MEQVRPLTIEALDLPKDHPVATLLDQKQRVLIDLQSRLNQERNGGATLIPVDRPKPTLVRELLPSLLANPFTLDPKDLIAIFSRFQRYPMSEMQTSFSSLLALTYGVQELGDSWKLFPETFLLSEGWPLVPTPRNSKRDLRAFKRRLAAITTNMNQAVEMTRFIPDLTYVHGLLNNDVKNGLTSVKIVIGDALDKFNQ